DDIAAVPIAALLTNAGGVADKTTFFYGNNLTNPSFFNREQALDKGGAFAEKLGISAFSYQDDITGTTQKVVDIINKGEKVLLIEGGPMEAVYRALDQVDPALHNNLTLLSHSAWNEDFNTVNLPGVTEARTWADIAQDFPGVTQVEITDQNAGKNNDKGFNNQNWSWMDSSNEPLVQEAREIMEQTPGTVKNDPSDAGMMLFALTGNENGTPQQAKAYLEESGIFDDGGSGGPGTPNPDPAPSGDVYEANANGVFHFDSEMAAPAGNWVAESKIDGFDGNNYFRWDGPNLYGNSQPQQNSALTFKFNVAEAGTHALAIEMARTKEGFNARGDEANDVFVSVNGGPPTKIFSSGMPFESFGDKWATTLDDVNGNKSPATFDLSEGVNTLTVFGRSKNAIIDNITMTPGTTPSRSDDQPLSQLASTQPDLDPNPNPDPDPNPDPGPGNPDTGAGAKFFLIDAETDQRIAELKDGSQINPADLTNASIEVVPPAGLAGISTVVLSLNGNTISTEGLAPYSMFGDIGQNITPGTLPEGPLTIGAVFRDASGNELGSAEVSTAEFGSSSGGDGGSSLLKLFVVDTATDEVITELKPGDTIDPATVEGRDVSIAAIPDNDNGEIGSVKLSLDGDTRVENVTPYALFGDKNGDYFEGKPLTEGGELKLEVFSGSNGTGQVLENVTVPFSVGSGDALASLVAAAETGGIGAATPTPANDIDAALSEMAELSAASGSSAQPATYGTPTPGPVVP
ncbi:MAG: hypothetical protein AAFR60_09080, partial [Pseudomonadota bacterium]